jgi:hypothetical protein
VRFGGVSRTYRIVCALGRIAYTRRARRIRAPGRCHARANRSTLAWMLRCWTWYLALDSRRDGSFALSKVKSGSRTESRKVTVGPWGVDRGYCMGRTVQIKTEQALVFSTRP